MGSVKENLEKVELVKDNFSDLLGTVWNGNGKVLDRTDLLKEVIRLLAPGGVFVICDPFSGSFLKAYKVKSVPELLERVRGLGIKDTNYLNLKEAGIELGRLANIWET